MNHVANHHYKHYIVIINRVMNHYYNHTQLLHIYYNHNYHFIIVFTMISYYYCLL